jgi:drug/metabolite transporter (DMT)-like permease
VIVPGLERRGLLGALVIVAAWVLTWVYVRWANNPLRRATPRLSDDRTSEPNVVAIGFFLAFIALSLGITVWRRGGRGRPTTLHRRAGSVTGAAELACAGWRLHERASFSA